MPILWDVPSTGVQVTDQEDIDRNYSRFEQAIHLCLEDWFDLLQSGQAQHVLPSAYYPKTWSEEALDNLVEAIDTYVEGQLKWANGYDSGRFDRNSGVDPYMAGPGFKRLLPPQRLTLAQDLDLLCREYGMSTGIEALPVAPAPIDQAFFDGYD